MSTSDDKIKVHISAAKKRIDLPDVGGTGGKCPTCGGDLEVGFGLAGGGYGVYEYCAGTCGDVVTKTDEGAE